MDACTFGKTLRTARRREKLYIADCARRMGLPAHYLMGIEVGRILPTPTQRAELEKFIAGEPYNVDNLAGDLVAQPPERQIFSHEEIKQYESYFDVVEALLETNQDKALYRSLIHYRCPSIQARYTFLQYTMPAHMAYLEFIKKDKIAIVIEGGVADGFTTKKFLKFADFVYGFEPAYESYRTDTVLATLDQSRIRIIPSALWNKRCQVHFFMNPVDAHSSKIVEGNHGTRVPAIPIDEFVREENITSVDYIKLDIEGGEQQALEGAAETIRAHRPQIAVSIYHKKEDLFEIPLLINTIVDQYRYKVAHYSDHHTETILYALPKEL